MPLPPLIPFADKCEDAASGLHRLRDGLSESASRIAALVSHFFAISAVLRLIHGEEGSRNYGLSFYQINDDLAVAFRTLGFTLEDVFDVFVKVRDRSERIVWEDLQHRLEAEETFPLAERLELYHAFFDAQLGILEGQVTPNPEPLRQSIFLLLEAQERARRRHSNAPRPRRPSRPQMHRMDTPVSPSIYSDKWDTDYLNRQRDPAPEPPLPLSPTCTSNSSRTMGSSQTSYSGDMYAPAVPPSFLDHWSLRVFDGRHPTTVYEQGYRSNERSICYGEPEPDAPRNLALDGFLPALRVAFDEESLSVQFYWRPTDHRARILVAVKDARGQALHYCQPLTNLRIVRDRTCLQLCRACRDGRYTLWARLNFYFHERMVLFYSTFTAMKRQDIRGGVIHRQLADGFELETDAGEEEVFSGQIKHNGMLHAVRIFRDRGSGVIRLEAAAHRGESESKKYPLQDYCIHTTPDIWKPNKLTYCVNLGSMSDVPLWTAFVTKYSNDPDWAAFEHGVVSLAAFRPSPYVFAAQYEPAQGRHGHYLLQFTTDNGMYQLQSLSCHGRRC